MYCIGNKASLKIGCRKLWDLQFEKKCRESFVGNGGVPERMSEALQLTEWGGFRKRCWEDS